MAWEQHAEFTFQGDLQTASEMLRGWACRDKATIPDSPETLSLEWIESLLKPPFAAFAIIGRLVHGGASASITIAGHTQQPTATMAMITLHLADQQTCVSRLLLEANLLWDFDQTPVPLQWRIIFWQRIGELWSEWTLSWATPRPAHELANDDAGPWDVIQNELHRALVRDWTHYIKAPDLARKYSLKLGSVRNLLSRLRKIHGREVVPLHQPRNW